MGTKKQKSPKKEVHTKDKKHKTEKSKRKVERAIKKRVNKAVKFINSKATKVNNYLEQIGKYIIDKIFKGNIEELRSKDPYKNASFRMICGHEDLKIDPSTLNRAANVAAQNAIFDKHDIDSDQLTYSHKVELLNVKDDKKKIKLAQQAITEGLSVRALAKKIRPSKDQVRGSNKPTEQDTKKKNIVDLTEDFKRLLPELKKCGEQYVVCSLTKIKKYRGKIFKANLNLRQELYLEACQLKSILNDYLQACGLLESKLKEAARENNEQKKWRKFIESN